MEYNRALVICALILSVFGLVGYRNTLTLNNRLCSLIEKAENGETLESDQPKDNQDR